MAKFKLPPISPLLGSNIRTYLKTLRYGRIDRKYYLKMILTFIIVIVTTPLRWYEELNYYFIIRKRKDTSDPVFVIGHWRSGTTYIHNVLAQDQQMGFVTTYQSVFPNYLSSKSIFKPFMKSLMPEKRPGDNVKLRDHYPQEDEFAISNMNPYTYYQFMYFPEQYQYFYRRFIRFEVEAKIKMKWIRDYQKMIQKACYNTGGKIPILKNPCNTGRISLLLECYPNAKFINIIRNPITLFLSARKFFTELLPTLWFHEVDNHFIENIVLDVYEMLMRDFLEIRSYIPQKNLIEFKFEDFEKDPMFYLENIYDQFDIPNYKEAKTKFEDYIKNMSGYQKNKYEVISEDMVEKILEKWGFAMDLWDYDVPEYLEVIKKEAVPGK